MPDENIENLIRSLPDPDSAVRFLSEMEARFPVEEKRLRKNIGLMSDVLALVSFSPLLATTLLQHKSYFGWLDRQRTSSKVRAKEELLESLARFALTNSMLETHVLLSRFRRRELLRIYLQDIRGLGTIAEITEEISNLADAILEHALRIARQELDNRFGAPQESDEKGRTTDAGFCVIALGKLGSRELNYSSDIDLLFLYSTEGMTSGAGTRGQVTNREYFVKLAEHVIKLVGQQSGEGAAYRVDMRLRPHGRVGALAVSIAEASEYYLKAAQPWERQVLIRSRACAGDGALFKEFAAAVAPVVYARGASVEEALANVRRSKEKIDLEKQPAAGFDVKLGIGGIREIEFIAQALQLAYGGDDEWLRAPHTLISLARLADRGQISETEHSELADAYTFLRRLEHRLQMEHGLQTHLLPNDSDRRELIARRMGYDGSDVFDAALRAHTKAVSAAFRRIFGESAEDFVPAPIEPVAVQIPRSDIKHLSPVFGAALSSIEKSGIEPDRESLAILERLAAISPSFANSVTANPELLSALKPSSEGVRDHDYRSELSATIEAVPNFAERLAAFRKLHSRLTIEIAVGEIFGGIGIEKAKTMQTALAEATVESALTITRKEIARRSGSTIEPFPFAVLGLGKLGGRSMDYGSDLDLVLVYDDEPELEYLGDATRAAFFGKAVEIFVTVVSSMTRDGSLYRVDLRLRPDGKNGAPASSRRAFVEYFAKRADIWELLAYVKLRAVGGDLELANDVESEVRRLIHDRAKRADRDELRRETLRVREMLEQQRASRNRREVDIKYGAGGMLDVYFAIRYLQLRDNVPDDGNNRSTLAALRRLFEQGSVPKQAYDSMTAGYAFLSRLDHELRLTVGRLTKFPFANRELIALLAGRLELGSQSELESLLTMHRLEIRDAYQTILGTL